jgi:rare lipoprotein A
VLKDTVKKTKVVVLLQEIKKDTVADDGELVLHKKMLTRTMDKFHGRRTASGVPFDRDKYTAAHKKLPLN